MISNAIPDIAGSPNTARLALVDFSEIIVVRDVASEVELLRELYAGNGQKALSICSRFDSGIANGEALVTLCGITI